MIEFFWRLKVKPRRERPLIWKTSNFISMSSLLYHFFHESFPYQLSTSHLKIWTYNSWPPVVKVCSFGAIWEWQNNFLHTTWWVLRLDDIQIKHPGLLLALCCKGVHDSISWSLEIKHFSAIRWNHSFGLKLSWKGIQQVVLRSWLKQGVSLRTEGTSFRIWSILLR